MPLASIAIRNRRLPQASRGMIGVGIGRLLSVTVKLLIFSFLFLSSVPAQESRSEQLRRHVESKEWDSLRDFNDVTELDLSMVRIEQDEIENLSVLTSLKKLTLRGTDNSLNHFLDDEAIKKLPKGIEHLRLEGFAFSSQCVPDLAEFKGLKHLDAHMTSIGRNSDADLSLLPNLTLLKLGDVTLGTVRSVCQLNSLESLSFECEGFDEATAAELGKKSSIKSLSIEGYWMPCEPLQYVKNVSEYSERELQIFELVRQIRFLSESSEDADRLLSFETRAKIAAASLPEGTSLPETRIKLRQDWLNTLSAVRRNSMKIPEKIDKLASVSIELAEKEFGKESDKISDVMQWLNRAVGGSEEILSELQAVQTVDEQVWIGCPKGHEFMRDFRYQGTTVYDKRLVSFRTYPRLTIEVEDLEEGRTGQDLIDSMYRNLLSVGDGCSMLRKKKLTFKDSPAMERKWTCRGDSGQQTTTLERMVVIKGHFVVMTMEGNDSVLDFVANRWFDSLDVRGEK